MANRVLGWVQNPSDFSKLKDVVQIFYKGSTSYNNLLKKLPIVVEDKNTLHSLLLALKTPDVISYKNLVGTAYKSRPLAKCDGLIQATIPAQNNKKSFVDDWTSVGFIRWAECLGFLHYNMNDDTFRITNIGKRFAMSKNENERDSIIKERMFTYPPALRILQLLSDQYDLFTCSVQNNNSLANDPYFHYALTKFELGSNLGFKGENGFTSYSTAYINNLIMKPPAGKTASKIRSTVEGTADKYARMIAKWWINLELVQKIELGFSDKKIHSYYMRDDIPGVAFKKVEKDSTEKNYYVGHSFQITASGAYHYNRYVKGSSSKSQTPPLHITWNMLATKAHSKDMLRSRRALILLQLKSKKKLLSIDAIKASLESSGYITNDSTIKKDIEGLVGIGILIKTTQQHNKNYYQILSSFEGLNIDAIPLITEKERNDKREKRKQKLREELDNIDAEYIELIDISYDSGQHRFFEVKVIETINNVQKWLLAEHLGGPRKPDGIAWNKNHSEVSIGMGVIIDMKSSSKGFSLDIKHQDQMKRYINECGDNDEIANPNKWWQDIPFNNPTDNNIHTKYSWLLVTSELAGKTVENAAELTRKSGVKGHVVDVDDLLRALSHLKRFEHKQIFNMDIISNVFPWAPYALQPLLIGYPQKIIRSS